MVKSCIHLFYGMLFGDYFCVFYFVADFFIGEITVNLSRKSCGYITYHIL